VKRVTCSRDRHAMNGESDALHVGNRSQKRKGGIDVGYSMSID